MPDSEHPAIVFRDGPAGLRPAVTDGPDVWEIVELFQQLPCEGEEAVSRAASLAALSRAQVRTAMGYYESHRNEIDAWIAANRRETDQLYAARQRSQDDRGS